MNAILAESKIFTVMVSLIFVGYAGHQPGTHQETTNQFKKHITERTDSTQDHEERIESSEPEATERVMNEFLTVSTEVLPPLDVNTYWAWAKIKDTAQAYRCFSYHYPDDPRATRAKERWAELDFVNTSKDNTLSAYRRFLRIHHESRFARKTARGSYSYNQRDPNSVLFRRVVDILIH